MLYQSSFNLSHSLDSLGFLPVSPIASQGTLQILTVPQGVEALLLVKRAAGVSELWFNVLAAGLRRFARSMPRDWDAIEPEHICAFLEEEGKVALEAGTSPQMIFKTYRDLVPREAAQAYFEIRPPAPG